MKEPLTFGDIRVYISRVDNISICMKETLTYQNYRWIEKVPHDFDSYYLYGIGMIESEIDKEDGDGYTFEWCLEFMLSEKPRKDI